MSDLKLYIFIDESGNHSQGKNYAVAASWCVSRRTRTTNVLQSTRDSVAEHIGVSGELKGSKTRPEDLDSVLPVLLDYGYDDGSISHSPVPWATSQPIRHTIHDVNPEVGKKIIGDLTGNPLDAPVTIQTLALASLLNPLFYPERLNESEFSKTKVVLDAETWRRPADNLQEAIESVNPAAPDNLSFETRDSDSTPGIQISDLTAYSWLRHRKRGDCTESARAVNKRRFSDY